MIGEPLINELVCLIFICLGIRTKDQILDPGSWSILGRGKTYPTASVTLAAKFWTTRFVMLWERGVLDPTSLVMLGICLMSSEAEVGLLVLANDSTAKGGG